MDWRSIGDGKEKYQAYLCSREWSEKKEAVRKRSKGVCERCRVNEMNAVHHLTYERKYAERLEDLQAICNQCHDFTHAKSQYDPRVYAPVFVEKGRPIRSVYLAGKITGDEWRNEIVEGWSDQRDSPFTWEAVVDSDGKEWVVAEAAIDAAFGAKLDYVGPWWSDLGVLGGHAWPSGCGDRHAYGFTRWGGPNGHGIHQFGSEKDRERAARLVSNNVASAIAECDLLFAWVNSDDCFGTIFEIGMAAGRGKTVVVASPLNFDHGQMWLCQRFAATRVFANTAGEAWKKLWAQVEEKSRATSSKEGAAK